MRNLDYDDSLAYEQEYENYIAEKMEEQRQECIKILGTIVRQDLAEDFAKILAAAYESESSEAEKISARFGFNQCDFFAIEENFKEFRRKFEENQMERDYD